MEPRPDPADEVDEVLAYSDLLDLQHVVIGIIVGIEERVDVLKAEIVTLKQEIARLKGLAARPFPSPRHHPLKGPSMIQTLTQDEVTHGLAGTWTGARDVDYVLDTAPHTRYRWDGSHLLPMAEWLDEAGSALLNPSGGQQSNIGFVNPLTTEGDLLTGAADGLPDRLGVGAADEVLTVVNDLPAWAPSTGLVVAGVPSEGDVVTFVGGVPTWSAP